MLVLTLREHQIIYIGEDITVYIIKISTSRVMVGIVAPKNVKIYRDNIIDKTEKHSKKKQ